MQAPRFNVKKTCENCFHGDKDKLLYPCSDCESFSQWQTTYKCTDNCVVFPENEDKPLFPQINSDWEMQSFRTRKHMLLLEELNKTYSQKNTDYGDSFHKTFTEEGFAMSRIRLSDKLERFKTLSKIKGLEPQVKDESMVDTLMDLANYAVMTVMEIERANSD